jgi:hypothetical protein
MPKEMLKKKVSSTVPFGYEVSHEDPKFLEAIPEQLEVLNEMKALVTNRVLSLREASTWIEHKTGRYLSHVGLKKIIDNEKNARQRLGG